LVVATPNGAGTDPKIPLFPGVTYYKNELGGQIICFSGTPEAKFHYTEAFSFLNQSRKLQLINLLRETGNLPVYYPGDQEVYLRAANMPDGALFVAFFNISLDPVENIELCLDRKVNEIQRLTPDGTYENVSFNLKDGVYVLDLEAQILVPQILIIK
jgi:hypothetical protein